MFCRITPFVRPADVDGRNGITTFNWRVVTPATHSPKYTATLSPSADPILPLHPHRRTASPPAHLPTPPRRQGRQRRGAQEHGEGKEQKRRVGLGLVTAALEIQTLAISTVFIQSAIDDLVAREEAFVRAAVDAEGEGHGLFFALVRRSQDGMERRGTHDAGGQGEDHAEPVQGQHHDAIEKG